MYSEGSMNVYSYSVSYAINMIGIFHMYIAPRHNKQLKLNEHIHVNHIVYIVLNALPRPHSATSG